MGVYINGIEMPKDHVRVLVLHPDGRAIDEWGNTYQTMPVPPHGRLVDADYVDRHLLRMQQAQTGPGSHGVRKSRAVLRDAPTVIQVEEG